MSNLLTKFTSTLKSVTHSVAKNGRHIYTAAFEDGSEAVIRTSGNLYVSVTQIKSPYLGHEDTTDFLFSRKAQPALKSWEQERFITRVQIAG
jgi:hypothetical protein